ncbi:MAG TPA: hypothetical protein VMS19_06730, partial [Methyloceanibacter sp.]|nr:hypothetical protein [Methyloceanibacter sp.]
MSRTKIVMAALAALVAAAIIVVYAQWGDNDNPAIAQANSQELAQGAEVEKPKAATGSEAPKSQQPAAPAPGSEASAPSGPEVIYDFNRLPDPIRETLQSIVVAAQTGNIDGMLPVLEENE